MATSTATATVKGGLFETQGLSSIASAGKGAYKRAVRMALSRRGAMAMRELMETLDGAIAGSTASKTLGRIENNAELGGVRVIETNTLVNRATVAGDITEINADLLALSTKTTFGTSPVANGDGNPLGTR